MPELPPLPPRNHEGEIIRVPSQSQSSRGGRNRRDQPRGQQGSSPSSSRENSNRSFPSSEAVAAGRGSSRGGRAAGEGDDQSSVVSAASSVSGLTMGTARHPAHVMNANRADAEAANRAKAAAAAVIGQDYGGGGSAVGINIGIPADDHRHSCQSGDGGGRARNANATSNERSSTDAAGRGRGRTNRPPAGAGAGIARSRRVRHGSTQQRARAALPMLAEDSDSSDDGEANPASNNSNNARGQSQSNERHTDSTTDPTPSRSGRHLLRVHVMGNNNSTSNGTSTPYVTDIGYDDDDTRHTVASKRHTLWERMGQCVDERRAARRGMNGAACRSMTATNKRMVGVGLLLLSAVIVIGCAVGYRNSSQLQQQRGQDQGNGNDESGGIGNGPNIGERPDDGGGSVSEDGGLPPSAAPTPWTVPEFKPTVPASSDQLCDSPIYELITDNMQSDDKLGTSMAMDRAGTVVVAGAPNADNLGSNAGVASLDTGAVFVYELPPDGEVNEAKVAKLVASDSARGMGFGTSVAISDDGNVLVVGAPSADVAFVDKVGAAYVFRKDSDDGTWREEARLVPTESISRMQFGRSVAIGEDGTRIVVGAPGGRRITAGSVTIFTYKADGGWTYTASIPYKNSDEAMFGLSVDISNDNIVVGAPLAGFQMEGEAYLFGAEASWDEVAMFSGFEARDEFGVDASIDGDRIAIGSQFANTQFGFNSGSVYVYKQNAVNNRWEPEVQISRVGMVTQGYKFGSSVDLAGSRLVAGAPGNSAAYVFTLEDDAWKETQRIEQADGSFGTSVAISSQTMTAIGDPAQNQNAGSTFVLENCYS